MTIRIVVIVSSWGVGTVGLPTVSGSLGAPHVGLRPIEAPQAHVSPQGVNSPYPPFQGSWPAYLFGMNRAAYDYAENTVARSNASQLGLEWNVTLPGPVVTSPTEANGVVYVGAWDGNEYALNAATGAMVWSKPTFLGVENFSGKSYGEPWLSPLGVSAAATVSGNHFYVSAFHNLYLLNATTGAILKNVTIANTSNPYCHQDLIFCGYYAWSSPPLFDGNVYVGISSQIDNPLVPGGVDMYNATTFNWEAQWMSYGGNPGGSVWSTPTLEVNNNTVWVTTGNGGAVQNGFSTEAIVALNASTLKRQGQWTVTGSAPDLDFGAGVTVFTAHHSSHYVLATNNDGYAYALNGSDLTAGLAWSDRTTTFPGSSSCQPPGQAIAPGAWDGSEVYLGGSFTTIGGVSVNGSVRSVYPNNGSYRSQAATPGTVQAGLAAGDGLVAATSRLYQYHTGSNGCPSYTGTNDSWLQVFNSTSGQQLFRYFLGYPVVAAPTIADRRIFVAATINNTTYWTDEQNHLGHVYAFGITLAAPSQVSPFYATALNGTVGLYAWGNATGGMPSYGSLQWYWGDSPTTSGHFGKHNYGNTPHSFVAIFSLIDATGSSALTSYKVTVGYLANCSFPAQFCTTISVFQCWDLLSCFLGPSPHPVMFAGGVHLFNGSLTYDWNFGDGSPDSSLVVPMHSYAEHGTHPVTMTITDSNHDKAVDHFVVTV